MAGRTYLGESARDINNLELGAALNLVADCIHVSIVALKLSIYNIRGTAVKYVSIGHIWWIVEGTYCW